MSSMKAWTKWQNWVAVAAGLYAALAPIWTPSDGKTTATLIVLGVLTVLAGLIDLAIPHLLSVEYAQGILGVLLFISPWVLAFTGLTGIALTAFVCGAVTIIATAWALPSVMKMHEGQHHRPAAA
ncbi:SPW repeat protein [Paenarthrobacter aromaticivorans]|uniref:SPW repeat protein n=1 Tax=Paenarthrobacter aromaticivorans TaxID=2849150 RepID=UPI003A800EC0